MGNYKYIKDSYQNGENINLLLNKIKDNKSENLSESDFINLSYDIQAGSYIKNHFVNYERKNNYMKFVVNELNKLHILKDFNDQDSCFNCCDLGTGEATNFSSFLRHLITKLPNKKMRIYGMDISLSRLELAKKFLSIESKKTNVKFFIGDMKNIPIKNNSMDLVLTVHSIEPNRSYEKNILDEIIRISKKYITIVEPIYETSSKSQKSRMDKFNYINRLRTEILNRNDIQVLLEKKIPLELCGNELNATTLFVLKKNDVINIDIGDKIFMCPIEQTNLHNRNGYWISGNGCCYPEINNFPILRRKFSQPYYHDI